MNDQTKGKDVILSQSPTLFDFDEIEPLPELSLSESVDTDERINHNSRMKEEYLERKYNESPQIQLKVEGYNSSRSFFESHYQKYQVSKINLDDEIKDFLDTFISPSTKITYEQSIKDFVKFCEGRGNLR